MPYCATMTPELAFRARTCEHHVSETAELGMFVVHGGGDGALDKINGDGASLRADATAQEINKVKRKNDDDDIVRGKVRHLNSTSRYERLAFRLMSFNLKLYLGGSREVW